LCVAGIGLMRKEAFLVAALAVIAAFVIYAIVSSKGPRKAEPRHQARRAGGGRNRESGTARHLAEARAAVRVASSTGARPERMALLGAARQHLAEALDEGPWSDWVADVGWQIFPEALGPAIDDATFFVAGAILVDLGGAFAHADDVFGWDFPLAEAASLQREALVETRRAAAASVAAESGGTPEAAAEAYVSLATRNTNDPENVHDHTVVAAKRATLERLKSDQAGATLPSLRAVAEEIASRGGALSEGRPALVEAALESVREMSAGAHVGGLGATDGECLARVWLRASDPRNAANSEKIKQAVFDLLVDARTGAATGLTACAAGRAERVLGALVLLDWDERNWGSMRLEELKNEVFRKAGALITDAAMEASASDCPNTRAAGLAFFQTTASAREPSEAEKLASDRLADEMRRRIRDMVDSFFSALPDASAVPQLAIEGVKKEAEAAVP
jgi:hypothetical protein